MTEKLSSIFNSSPHLTRSETKDYISGKLSGSDLRRVELHLADCEFCSDAVEGLKMMKADEAEKILDEANEAIHKSIQPEKESRVFIKRWIAVAATFLALIVSSFFINYYLHQDKTELAQEIKPSVDTVSKVQPNFNEISNPTKNENISSGLAQENPVQKKETGTLVLDDSKANGLYSTKAPVVNEDLDQDEKVAGYSTANKNKEEQSAPVTKSLSDSVSLRETTVTVSGTTVSAQTNPDATYSWAPSYELETISKKDKRSKNPVTEAREEYNNGDYNGALKDYKKTLSTDKDNVEANYFAGMSEMKLKHYESALAYFDAILSNPNNPFFTIAQWQKSLTLIAKGDKLSAQILLNKIIFEGKEYKDSAQQKLSELK